MADDGVDVHVPGDVISLGAPNPSDNDDLYTYHLPTYIYHGFCDGGPS